MLYVPSVTNMTINALQPGGDRSDMSFIGGGGGGGGRGAAPPAGARGAGPVRPLDRAVLVRPDPAPRSGAVDPKPPEVVVAADGDGGAPPLGPGASRGPWGIGPQGLPLVKPPYGRITAYNMNTGDIVWQVANGDTYEWIKTHPALKGPDDSEDRTRRRRRHRRHQDAGICGTRLRAVQGRRRRRPRCSTRTTR